MPRTHDEMVWDIWTRLPYDRRLVLASRYGLKRSGVIQVVNQGNGKSYVQSDGFLSVDLSIFSAHFMREVLGAEPEFTGEPLVINFFNYDKDTTNTSVDAGTQAGDTKVEQGGDGGSKKEGAGVSQAEAGNEGGSNKNIGTSIGANGSGSGDGAQSTPGVAGDLSRELHQEPQVLGDGSGLGADVRVGDERPSKRLPGETHGEFLKRLNAWKKANIQ